MNTAANREAGFTLLEMLVVLVIIGLLAGVAVPLYFNQVGSARLQKVEADMSTIATALALYKLDNSIVPSTEQGLEALVRKPQRSPVPQRYKPSGYIVELPSDPWDQPYQYLSPSRDGSAEYELFSWGADGRRGGSGDDADVYR